MSHLRVAGSPTAYELAVAKVRTRGGIDLLCESTLDGYRGNERRLALATSLHTDSAACAGG